MEYERLFGTIGVVIISVIALFSLLNFYNESYNTNVGGNFTNTLSHVSAIGNATLINMSNEGANATQAIEGAGAVGGLIDLATRSLQIITIVPTLMGLVPALMEDAAIMIGIPPEYVAIGVAIFLFSFIILLAYLLLIGTKRLL